MEPLQETNSISNFHPTEKMILLKEKVHKYLPSNVVGQLSPESISKVKSYLYPVSVEEINTWILQYPQFWFWLILPHTQIVRQERLKSRAMDVVQDVLEGNVADPKMAMIQLKAAQLLLSFDNKPQKSVTNNNLNVGRGAGGIPKHLASKSMGELQSEIARLSGGVQKEED